MSRRLPSLQEALSQSSRPTAPLPEARSVHHMEVRQIPVETYVLEDFASYLETAPFRLVADAEVYADPQQLLGLKCRHLTMALGVRQGTVCSALRGKNMLTRRYTESGRSKIPRPQPCISQRIVSDRRNIGSETGRGK